MSFFNILGEDEIVNPSGEKLPPASSVTDKRSEGEVKQEEVRKMGGFTSIQDVAKSAPTDYKDAPPSTGTGKRQTARQAEVTKKALEEAKKEDRRQKALETIGKRYAEMLAKIPYKMWARFADDQRLDLTKEEAAELAQSYFELAQAINPDLTSPWVIGIGVIIQNGMLVTARLKYLADEEKENAENRNLGQDSSRETEAAGKVRQ